MRYQWTNGIFVKFRRLIYDEFWKIEIELFKEKQEK